MPGCDSGGVVCSFLLLSRGHHGRRQAEYPLNPLSSFARPSLSIDPRYPFHQQTREICDELGLELLGNYEGTSLDSLCQMCASGLGLAILPELYLRSEVGGKNVVAPLEVVDWSGSRSVAALWRGNSVYSENFRKIAEVIDREASLLLKKSQPERSTS